METVTIKLNKKKLVLAIFGAAMFVCVSLWMILDSDLQTRRYSPILIKIAGVVGVVFFGMCLIYGIIKLFDYKPALVIDKNGITDNSSITAAGFIPWSDIINITFSQIQSKSFLMIHLSNPDNYMIGKNAFKKHMMLLNQKMYGTPILISAIGYSHPFNDLTELIQTRLAEYKSKNS